MNNSEFGIPGALTVSHTLIVAPDAESGARTVEGYRGPVPRVGDRIVVSLKTGKGEQRRLRFRVDHVTPVTWFFDGSGLAPRKVNANVTLLGLDHDGQADP